MKPPPPLSSNCLSLPFGPQGRSRSQNETYFLQTRNGGHRKDLYAGGPNVLLRFSLTWGRSKEVKGTEPFSRGFECKVKELSAYSIGKGVQVRIKVTFPLRNVFQPEPLNQHLLKGSKYVHNGSQKNRHLKKKKFVCVGSLLQPLKS